MEDLTHEQKVILHKYLLVFSSPDGQDVLADLKKSWFDKPFDEGRFEDRGYLVARATEHNCYLKIVRCMQRAAEHVQRMEGVEPSRSPMVETDFEAEENP